MIRACECCGEDTNSEWEKYCCYWCSVTGEKEKQKESDNE